MTKRNRSDGCVVGVGAVAQTRFDATMESSSPGGVAKVSATCRAAVTYICNSGYMNEHNALDALGALSQQTRLNAFRLLVGNEPEGLPAGEIARALGVPQNTMSTHLATLAQCGLVRGERFSRSIVYRADLVQFRALLMFLLEDCCGGSPEICAPLLADIAPCCQPSKRKEKRRG